MQKNWIGKSTGAEVQFTIKSDKEKQSSDITIFTTRPDTLFGATFMVLSPEHSLINEYKNSIKNLDAVKEYIEKSQKKSRFLPRFT